MDRYERAALTFTNNVRAALGLPPVDRLLPGNRHDDLLCPVARTIRLGAPPVMCVSVDAENTALLVGGEATRTFHNSAAVTGFLERFDRNYYPDLDAERAA